MAFTTVYNFPKSKQNSKFLPHPSIYSQGKRLLDILGAIIGLCITAFLFIPVAIAIKLDSPGAILFSQTRCGYKGQEFKIWKFRSMVTDAEKLQTSVENKVQGAFFKNDKDPRITRVGKFLRKTSLDEFPQFWNVLQGEMSLVGTRPPTVREARQYSPKHLRRLDVKPGLTGEWQVNGRSLIDDFEKVVELDLRYQEKWTLTYDFGLILKTIQLIFSRDNGAC